MKILEKACIFALLVILAGCNPDDPDNPDDNPKEPETGTVVFDFLVPARNVPAEGVHRIDLSIAEDAQHLYRGDFLICANVSDRVRFYTFDLMPGDYYYQAGIACSCLGDTCLWDGFPGGRYGAKWTMGRISIVKGERLEKVLQFNN
ncbi:MAG: hypothetical protein R6V75_02300 [Bacteroidales bacterium]